MRMNKILSLAVACLAVPCLAADWLPGVSYMCPCAYPVEGNIGGFDLALLDTYRQSVAGVALSLGLSECDKVYGAQVATLWCRDEYAYGLQVSAGLSVSTEELYGVQCGVIDVADRASALQAGLLNLCGTPRWAVQLGAFNIGDVKVFDFPGGPGSPRAEEIVQLGAVNWTSGGLQAGFLNLGGDIQVGIINSADDCFCQIGLINMGYSSFQLGALNFGEYITPLIGWTRATTMTP